KNLPILVEVLAVPGALFWPLDDLHSLEPERDQKRLGRPTTLPKRGGGRGRVAAAEPQPANLRRPKLRQRHTVAVEAGEATRRGRCSQLSGQLIGPRVVGAAHHRSSLADALEDE